MHEKLFYVNGVKEYLYKQILYIYGCSRRYIMHGIMARARREVYIERKISHKRHVDVPKKYINDICSCFQWKIKSKKLVTCGSRSKKNKRSIKKIKKNLQYAYV